MEFRNKFALVYDNRASCPFTHCVYLDCLGSDQLRVCQNTKSTITPIYLMEC